VLIIRRSNCINTETAIVFCVSDRPVCRLSSTPDGHLGVKYYTTCCIDTIRPPDDEHSVARNM